MSPSKVSTISFTEFDNIIDGQPRNAKEQYQGINPATGQSLWDVPVATQKDLDDAVASAAKAFTTWRAVPIEERKAKLQRLCDLYMSYSDEFVNLLMQETGKPRQFAAMEVNVVSFVFKHHLGLSMPEERIEDDEKVCTTRYMPLGVVGAICPWNFPLILTIGKIIPALLTGCTIIVKPSPFTPYTIHKFVELAQEIFAPGILSSIGGSDMLGPWMTVHPGIQKISFTGSIATGKKIMASCASTLKRVTLELGGNDASIVLPDVDIEKVAPQLVLGAFQNSGQVCVATKRIYIHESIYEPMLAAMAAFAKSLKYGLPDEEGVMLGPIQNRMQFERVKGFYEDSKSKGYKFVAGGPDIPSGKGFFVQPSIIDNPPSDSRIITEEPFGPIVPTQPWSDEEEVIARANDTNTGLGACVWSADAAHAEKIAMRLEAGSVFVNSFEKPNPQVAFSGHKESGIGSEWGTTGLLAYCNAHVIHVYKS